MQLNNLASIPVEDILAAVGEDNEEGGTNYDDAFRSASILLNRPIGGGDKFTIMISDGEPRTDRNNTENEAAARASAQFRFANQLAPRIKNAYLLFLGNAAFRAFARSVSGPERGSLTTVNQLNNIERYFDKFEFYFQCWSGPLNPRLVDNDFPFPETWAWVVPPQDELGFPLDYAENITDVGGDPNDPNKSANSLFYLIADPEDNDGVEELSIFYSEYICRKLEDQNHRIAVRHGWSSIIDHNLQVLPFGIDLPDLP